MSESRLAKEYAGGQLQRRRGISARREWFRCPEAAVAELSVARMCHVESVVSKMPGAVRRNRLQPTKVRWLISQLLHTYAFSSDIEEDDSRDLDTVRHVRSAIGTSDPVESQYKKGVKKKLFEKFIVAAYLLAISGPHPKRGMGCGYVSPAVLGSDPQTWCGSWPHPKLCGLWLCIPRRLRATPKRVIKNPLGVKKPPKPMKTPPKVDKKPCPPKEG